MAEEAGATAADTPTNVFLSYARADKRVAEKLAHVLGASGLTIWWDELIEGGAAFANSIAVALDRADVVLVLWSKASIESDWVRDEAALGRDRRRLVPVTLDGGDPPLGFRQYQSIDLSQWHGKANAPQVDAIVRAIAIACHQPAPLRSKATAAPVTRRNALVAGGVAGVAAIGGVGWWTARHGLLGGGAARGSIAILPFKNLSGDPAQAYFSEGLTEELRSALARNGALKVMAGTSSAAAGEGTTSLVDIAAKLDVAYVLDGAVRHSGDMVRISANLSEGETGFSRWSQTFDRKLADIFALQSEIAGVVARAMAAQVESSAPAPGGTASAAGYDAYLRGRSMFNAAKDEATDRAALDQYGIALAADANFALAHAARSRSLAALAAEYGKPAELKSLYDDAIAAANRAIAIAPDIAEGQLALGYALYTGRLDAVAARTGFDRARALGGGNADILLPFALYAVRVGRRGEALAAVGRALALDPLNPRTHRAAGTINYAIRRYAPAIDHLKRALALRPTISNASGYIGSCLYQQGRIKEARAAFAAESHDFVRLSGLAIADHRLGNVAAARASMATMVKTLGDSTLYQQAQVLAQWGEGDAAVAMLARARAKGDAGVMFLATDPMLDPVVERPEVKAMIAELHLG